MSEAWMRRLMFQAYAFVLGVVAGKFYLLSDRQSAFCQTLFALLLAFSFFGFVRARRGRFPMAAAVFLFGLSAFFLGWGRYSETAAIGGANHISKYTTDSWKNRVSVEGVIVTEPDVYSDQVRFTLNPIQARRTGADEFTAVTGGKVEVTVRRSAPDLYRQFSQSAVYGWRIRVNAPLLVPQAAANPGGFSYQDFLADQDIYAGQTVAVSWGAPPPIEVLDQGEGIFLTEWALRVKERVLSVLVRTIPHPESAFLAGVTLGMKSVLKDVVCIVPGDGRLVTDEFRMAGVSHVLAVSGLHVTIISAMLIAILSALRIPLRIQAPLVIFALVLFMILTGMAPATLRATLMNSLAIFFLAMTRGGFKVSLLFAIAEAAMIVLFIQPKNIVQPSFTLSFAAVLSLSLLSGPIEKVLLALRGPTLIWAVLTLFGLTTLSTRPLWDTFTKPAVVLAFFAAAAWGLWRCRQEDLRDKWPDFRFDRCPPFLRLFIVAQGAILLGMMFPLSSYYFGRYSLAGAYANFVAIPLTGIIVPIGLMAGLVGMIPGVGMFIALILNAANFIFIKFFLYVAHASAVIFPYPFISQFTPGQLVVYYAAITAFIWMDPIRSAVLKIYNKSYKYAADPRIRRNVAGLAAVAAAFLVLSVHEIWKRPPAVPPGTLRLTFLSTPYGGAAVVQCPDGKTFLVDGSLNNPKNHFDAGEKVIAPFLLKQGITHLDGVILTHSGPEHTEGLATILEGFDVEAWYDPVPVQNPGRMLELMETDTAAACRLFFRETGDAHSEARADVPHVRRICEGYIALVRASEERRIPRVAAKAGFVVTESSPAGHALKITFMEGGVVRISHGKFSALLTGDASETVLREHAARGDLAADVLTVPGHGFTETARQDWLMESARPKAAVFQSGNPAILYGKSREAKPLVDRAKEEYDENRAYYEKRLGPDRVFDSRLDWAVIVDSDGKTFQIQTLKPKQSDAGGVDGAS
ncbi:ComEC/Rec2 family competence protein [bacterium]|nr:ComEC/Rec2 family competence protein [bacterium]